MKTHVPGTLEDCFVSIDYLLSPKAKQEIIDSDNEKFMNQFHHVFGRHIRNEWGLWTGDTKLFAWFKSIGLNHADDMSGVILTSYWRHLHNKSLDIEGQVKYYQNYWESKEGDV